MVMYNLITFYFLVKAFWSNADKNKSLQETTSLM